EGALEPRPRPRREGGERVGHAGSVAPLRKAAARAPGAGRPRLTTTDPAADDGRCDGDDPSSRAQHGAVPDRHRPGRTGRAAAREGARGRCRRAAPARALRRARRGALARGRPPRERAGAAAGAPARAGQDAGRLVRAGRRGARRRGEAAAPARARAVRGAAVRASLRVDGARAADRGGPARRRRALPRDVRGVPGRRPRRRGGVRRPGGGPASMARARADDLGAAGIRPVAEPAPGGARRRRGGGQRIGAALRPRRQPARRLGAPGHARARRLPGARARALGGRRRPRDARADRAGGRDVPAGPRAARVRDRRLDGLPARRARRCVTQRFDIVVVGGGTAGCILAARLSEDSGRTVCLLEAGPDYGPLAGGRWPAEMLDARAMPFTHDWGSGGEDGRSLGARILGGSSAHNACAMLAGTPADYDEWGPGWGWETIAPYLARARAALRTQRANTDRPAPFHAAVVEAAQALGLPLLADADDPASPVGVAPF